MARERERDGERERESERETSTVDLESILPPGLRPTDPECISNNA